MTAQLNLLTPPDAAGILAALTPAWQSLDDLEAATGIATSAWPHATRLVREYRAQHRVADGVDFYRLPDAALTTKETT